MYASITIGKEAPDFVLKNQNNKSVNLKNYRGRWVILHFCSKDISPQMLFDMRTFNRYSSKYKKMGVVFLGISDGDVPRHQSFLIENNLKLDFLSDTNKRVSSLYEAQGIKVMGSFVGLRNTYLIDPEGKISHIWKGINSLGHPDSVLSKLKEKIFMRKHGRFLNY